MSEKKKGTRYPCHIWEIGDAEEAKKAFRVMRVSDLGSDVMLEDRTLLHINHDEQDDCGSRELLRCRTCGGLILSQSSVDCWDPTDIDADDDYMPVSSPEEAGLLNILLDYGEFYQLPGRIFHTFNNSLPRWRGTGDPVPNDPEELKEKIRQKYSGLKPEQKEMLEKLISKAGELKADD